MGSDRNGIIIAGVIGAVGCLISNAISAHMLNANMHAELMASYLSAQASAEAAIFAAEIQARATVEAEVLRAFVCAIIVFYPQSSPLILV